MGSFAPNQANLTEYLLSDVAETQFLFPINATSAEFAASDARSMIRAAAISAGRPALAAGASCAGDRLAR
jgi:hypothetical protein